MIKHIECYIRTDLILYSLCAGVLEKPDRGYIHHKICCFNCKIFILNICVKKPYQCHIMSGFSENVSLLLRLLSLGMRSGK